jgi:hypothetical protein
MMLRCGLGHELPYALVKSAVRNEVGTGGEVSARRPGADGGRDGVGAVGAGSDQARLTGPARGEEAGGSKARHIIAWCLVVN